VLNYQYDKKIYEQNPGLGRRCFSTPSHCGLRSRETVATSSTMSSSTPVAQVRGIYKICIAANEAIARLKAADRRGALAALLDAQPLVEELYAHTAQLRRRENWQLLGAAAAPNKDMYLMYNLYQKARLRLESGMDPVTEIEPNATLTWATCHARIRRGGATRLYVQAERLNGSVFMGRPFSILSLPLADVFQIGGVQSTYSKWNEPVPDLWTFLSLPASKRRPSSMSPPKKKLDWLAQLGFETTGKTMEIRPLAMAIPATAIVAGEDLHLRIVCQAVPCRAGGAGKKSKPWQRATLHRFRAAVAAAVRELRGNRGRPAAARLEGRAPTAAASRWSTIPTMKVRCAQVSST